MQLEKEIKQEKFKSEFEKLAVNIFYTHGWLNNLQSKLFKAHKLSPTQYNILRILRGQYPNPAPITLIKERMLDKMSDVSRIVDRMKSKRLLIREYCKEDRRRVNVMISEYGLELLSEIDKDQEQFLNKIENISVEEAKKLNNLLDKLRG